MKIAKERNDEWGKEVMMRLVNIIDAVAADAMHHLDCYWKFRRDKKKQSDAIVNIDNAMKEVIDYL